MIDEYTVADSFTEGGIWPENDISFRDFALLCFKLLHETHFQTTFGNSHLSQNAVLSQVEDSPICHLDVDEVPSVFAA